MHRVESHTCFCLTRPLVHGAVGRTTLSILSIGQNTCNLTNRRKMTVSTHYSHDFIYVRGVCVVSAGMPVAEQMTYQLNIRLQRSKDICTIW